MHHVLGQRVLAVKEHLQGGLGLCQRPLALMPCAQNGNQHIGVVFDGVQIVMVLVIVVGALVGIQIILELRLQRTVSGLGPQHIPVLGGVGGGPHRACGGVPQRDEGGRAGLEGEDEHRAGQRDKHPHGMPFHKAHGPLRQLFRGGGSLFGGLCPLSGGLFRRLPRLFGVLLFQLLLVPVAGDNIPCKLRVLLGRHPELVVRPGLDVLRLRLVDGPGRVLPDALSCVPRPLPEDGLAHQLGAVGPLGSHVFMLHLVNLAMHKAVGAPPGGPQRPAHRAPGFRGLFALQLFPGPVQLVLPRLHAELGLADFLVFAFHAEL